MVGAVGKWPWKREEKSAEISLLEESLQEVRSRLAQAYAGFNFADDGELVESYVYEIQALQARYSYLLRQRKALGGERANAALPADHRPAQAVTAT